MVVWAETLYGSPDTYTIYSQVVKPDGDLDGGPLPISSNTGERKEVDIAYSRQVDLFCVVWEWYHDGWTKNYIKGRRVEADGNATYSGEIFIAEPALGDNLNPAIASVRDLNGDNRFFVIFQTDSDTGHADIHGRFINKFGTPGDLIDVSNGIDKSITPAVNGSESAQAYLVAWRQTAGIMDIEIRARQFTSSGLVLGVEHDFGGMAVENPAIAAGPLGDFLVTWQDHPLWTNSENVWGALFGNRNYIPLINH